MVDGAHNAASLQALIRAVGQNVPYDSMVMVFGCAADKDITGMLDQVATGADKVIFTKAKGNPRAAAPEDLAAAYEECKGKYGDLKKALLEDIETLIAPMREKREKITDDDVRQILQNGARKAQKRAELKMQSVKAKIGVSL